MLALATGAALLGRANWAGSLTLLGAGLLVMVWETALRGSHSLLLTLTRESLTLAPQWPERNPKGSGRNHPPGQYCGL